MDVECKGKIRESIRASLTYLDMNLLENGLENRHCQTWSQRHTHTLETRKVMVTTQYPSTCNDGYRLACLRPQTALYGILSVSAMETNKRSPSFNQCDSDPIIKRERGEIHC